MKARVRVTIHRKGMMDLEDLAVSGTRRVAGKVRDRSKEIITSEGRVDTGAMRQSIESVEVSRSGGKVTFEVGSRLEYAIYQHEGVEGPIYPRRAKVLRFKPSGSSSYVFSAYSSGFAGIKFLTRALNDVSADDAT